MAGRKPKADCRADARGGGWAGLPHVALDSPAYQNLSLYARAVLVEIVRKMNGYNNGKIAISQRQIAERLSSTNYRAISKAIAELMAHGFIDVVAEGQWKERQAREYRLTFVNTMQGNFSRPATNDYRDWSPLQKSGADDVSAGKPRSADDVSAGHSKTADDVSARIANHRRKTAIPENVPADDVSSLISKPYPGPSMNEGKHGNSDPQNPVGPILAKPPGMNMCPEIRRAYWEQQLGIGGDISAPSAGPQSDGDRNG